MLIKDGASTVASLNQAGVLSCQSLLIDSVPYRGYKEIAALNMQQAYTMVSGGGAVSGWSYTYTGSGGIVKISVYISCYVSTVPQSNSWSLWKADDIVPSAFGLFWFTTANNHMTMPVLMHIDTRRSTAPTTWRIEVRPGLIVDTQDRCTMLIAKY